MRMYTIARGAALLLVAGFTLTAAAAPDDVAGWIKTLTSTSAKSDARVKAANEIGKRGGKRAKDVEDAIDPLQKVAEKDKDNSVRKAAISALGAIAPEDDVTVPLLTSIVKNDPSKEMKVATIQALARFGTRAKSAMPAINEFGKTLDKKDPAKRMLKDINKQIQGN
jgi:HEAT repeat protein